MGFEPTNDFRRCRFSRSANPLRALPKRTPRKTGAKRRRGPRQRATDTLAQRPEPNQFETQRAKSRPLARQVSDKSRLACLEMTRNGGNPDEAAPSVPLPFPGTAVVRSERFSAGLHPCGAVRPSGRPGHGRTSPAGHRTTFEGRRAPFRPRSPGFRPCRRSSA